MDRVNFEDAQQEYWFHVSPQEVLPLAGAIEINIDLDRVSKFFKVVERAAAENVQLAVSQQLLENTSLFGDVRQFLGISDKRAYLDLSYIFSRTKHPTEATSLCGCFSWTLSRHPLSFFVGLLEGSRGPSVQKQASIIMADYLLDHGLARSAPDFSRMSAQVLEMLYAGLISSKEYQQRAAKRRGHGCEAALASVLKACSLDIVPADKPTNPMGARDPNVDLATMEIVDRTAGKTHSFDTVITYGDRPRVLVQSLIHTSDPGQYGVNKSDETIEIAKEISAWTRNNPKSPVDLWALLDGVGFSENKPQTINKLLANVDFFIQLKTLFKAPLKAHSLGLTKVKAIHFSPNYSDDQINQLVRLYVPDDVDVIQDQRKLADTKWKCVSAGQAVIYC